MTSNRVLFLPLKLARKIRDFIYKEVSPNAVLTARLKSRLRSEYESGQIKIVFDIGAHKGEWASEIKNLMPNARMILFEANPIHSEVLKSKGFEYHIGILSKPGVKQCTFFSPDEHSSSTGASYYKEVTKLFDSVEGVELAAGTLADIVSKAALPQPDFIKIDTQGSEIDIMSGGVDIFKQARLVLIELPIIECNHHAPALDAYLNCMSELGFLPIELCEIHKFGQVVIQVDILFQRKDTIDASILEILRH